MKRLHSDEQGMATLESTLMVVILVPLLFAILEFGWLTQRWLAQDGVTLQAARYAGERCSLASTSGMVEDLGGIWGTGGKKP